MGNAFGCNGTVPDNNIDIDDSLVRQNSRHFTPILDNYNSLEEVVAALRKAGLESSDMIIGIDFTKSNTWQGQRTFGGQCLHALGHRMNPYQEVIQIMGQTLSNFDDDDMIPVYGFGDLTTKAKGCFQITGTGPYGECHTHNQVLQRYTQEVQRRTLSGPTNFAPVINQAINIVQRERSYHILIIIADGAVTAKQKTADAIVRASNYPLSIVVIGVGDGPWDLMEEFDDELPERKFDNFQFVNWNEVKENARSEAAFALAALMEIPDQYRTINKLGYLEDVD